MVQRNWNADPIAFLNFHPLSNLQTVVENIVVSQRDTLRVPGGPRSELNVRIIMGGDQRLTGFHFI